MTTRSRRARGLRDWRTRGETFWRMTARHQVGGRVAAWCSTLAAPSVSSGRSGRRPNVSARTRSPPSSSAEVPRTSERRTAYSRGVPAVGLRGHVLCLVVVAAPPQAKMVSGQGVSKRFGLRRAGRRQRRYRPVSSCLLGPSGEQVDAAADHRGSWTQPTRIGDDRGHQATALPLRSLASASVFQHYAVAEAHDGGQNVAFGLIRKRRDEIAAKVDISQARATSRSYATGCRPSSRRPAAARRRWPNSPNRASRAAARRAVPAPSTQSPQGAAPSGSAAPAISARDDGVHVTHDQEEGHGGRRHGSW